MKGHHSLQQIGNLNVAEAVVPVVDLGPLAEQCIGALEEQNGAGAFGLLKDPFQILLRFTATERYVNFEGAVRAGKTTPSCSR